LLQSAIFVLVLVFLLQLLVFLLQLSDELLSLFDHLRYFGWQFLVFISFLVTNDVGRDRPLQSLSNSIRAIPIHGFNNEVSRNLHDGRVHFCDFYHHVQRLDALGRVARTYVNNQVIAACCQVVYRLDNAIIVDACAVDSLQGFLTIDAHDFDNALGVVDFRNKVDNDTGAVADGAAQVVDVGEVCRVSLALTGKDSAARCLVRLLTKGR